MSFEGRRKIKGESTYISRKLALGLWYESAHESSVMGHKQREALVDEKDNQGIVKKLLIWFDSRRDISDS